MQEDGVCIWRVKREKEKNCILCEVKFACNRVVMP